MFIQKFKNKIKNRKLNFLILLIILTVVIHSIPKKIFTILNTSFIERKTSIAYDYWVKVLNKNLSLNLIYPIKF